MNQSTVFHVFKMFQVGNFEGTNRVDDRREREVATVRRLLFSQTATHCAEEAKDLRSIKSLTLAVLTDAHDDPSPFSAAADMRTAQPGSAT